MDMFKFISNYIDLNKMSEDSAKKIVEHIITVIDDEKGREQVNHAATFLCVLRKQNRALTENMDKKVAQYFPKYYNGIYKLETAINDGQELHDFVKGYIERIKTSNETQGKNGTYFGHGTREIATVKIILSGEGVTCAPETMDDLISTVINTLVFSKESISIKLDAIALLIYIAIKHPEDYARNQHVYENLFNKQDEIEITDNSFLSSNIDGISLKIGLRFLYTAMGKDVHGDILELMPLIQGDVATTIAVSKLLVEYLETNATIILPPTIDAIVLQNVLQWLNSEHLDVRWNAVRILLALSRNIDNQGVVNHQLITLIDSNGVHIKNLIIRQLYKISGITDSTREYIMSKCKNDANYVVRKVCDEVENSKVG